MLLLRCVKECPEWQSLTESDFKLDSVELHLHTTLCVCVCIKNVFVGAEVRSAKEESIIIHHNQLLYCSSSRTDEPLTHGGHGARRITWGWKLTPLHEELGCLSWVCLWDAEVKKCTASQMQINWWSMVLLCTFSFLKKQTESSVRWMECWTHQFKNIMKMLWVSHSFLIVTI